MHEMSIMEGVLALAGNEAGKHGYQKITRIKLRIGEFRGVVREALEFAFDAMKGDTAAKDAVLEIETVAIRLECPNCKRDRIHSGRFESSLPRMRISS
ncbi:MAG: hydrogenase maturation nickel metallochaperone HypA [Acidobacteria bacterium]|nr:hydrogenase maturation nickel metallochaperone HypA [Acidobacteriota bacterium]